MTQFSYTAEAWAASTSNPVNRRPAVEALFEKAGGKLIDIYYAYGDYDGVLIGEFPGNIEATAVILAAIEPGHVRAIKLTVLLTVEGTVEALGKAKGLTYQAPTR